MYNLHVHGPHTHYYLTGYYLPSVQDVRSIAPQVPKELRPPAFDFELAEEALAWTLTRLGRRVVGTRWREFGDEDAMFNVHLATRVLGPSNAEDGRLATWFQDEPESTRYRVVIHAMPAEHMGRDVPQVWDEVYKGVHKRSRSLLKEKQVPLRAICEARELLEELVAYSNVHTWDRQLAHFGHTVWSSPLDPMS